MPSTIAPHLLTTVPLADPVIESHEYEELIAKEARHWGEILKDPKNPQIWHDDKLFDIFFGKEYRLKTFGYSKGGPRFPEN